MAGLVAHLVSLRKRLGIDRENFVVCATGPAQEQAQGLSSTYELAFTSERDLPARLERLFQARPNS